MRRLIDTTLLVLVKDNRILLATKKRGFGQGLYNGVGGKRQEGEDIYNTMLRETMEEISIKPKSAKQVGLIYFNLFLKGEPVREKMHIYLANDYDGEPTESDEMKPEWFDLDRIPFENMFEDDRTWLPEVLKGNLVKGDFDFDENNKILSQRFKVVSNFDEEL